MGFARPKELKQIPMDSLGAATPQGPDPLDVIDLVARLRILPLAITTIS